MERNFDIKKFIERLQNHIDFAIEYGDYDKECSWDNQQGVLLSYKEAEELIEILKNYKQKQ